VNTDRSTLSSTLILLESVSTYNGVFSELCITITSTRQRFIGVIYEESELCTCGPAQIVIVEISC
jgi:hypothetical protein